MGLDCLGDNCHSKFVLKRLLNAVIDCSALCLLTIKLHEWIILYQCIIMELHFSYE